MGAVPGFVEPEAFAARRTECDLTGIARDAIVSRAALAAAKSIDLGLARATEAKVQGDAATLAILLSNLLDNAIRYTPSGGRIDVAIDSDEAGATLSVTDTGPGIAPEDRERVFDRFHRGSATEESGSGLGLSIVKRIADAHRATITLDAPVEGTGLVVKVRFPRLAAGD